MENPIDILVGKLGSLTKASEILGVSNPSVIANWRARGRIPAERVLEVERITGISRHELRPDVFGPPVASREAAE
ncbi:YdaS family helix-turn-helix protein [Nitratireductor sp.]|uniref:transcriptional regulator n=1 Tax=Nitratireductor sp. TaxID=1872084 RepID=UPI0026361517|nr:YdaS family helix-turn-helix protein [Nitratireductor sp.]MCV0379022.1 helix-turn-helix domain-containing protein [Nitratireductor sp.]